MNFDWNDNITCRFTGEEFNPDSLDRAKYAEYLTNYLKSYKNESYVFNINSPWGSGKTYFIKRWANTLAEKHPVIYFNSWKHDSNNEPLVLILSEIIKGLKELISDKSDEVKELRTKTFTVLKRLAPTLSKGLFQKVTGTNFDELVGNSVDDEEQGGENKIAGEFGAAAAQALLDLHEEQAQAIDSLKEQVELILDKVITDDGIEHRKRRPMYVFIDELDRCRPTFAIELLEVIKHIFDIPKIIFVIATDTEQLQHSIKAVYGEGFDAERYLMRFFNRSFSLPDPILALYLKNHRSFKNIAQRLILTNELNIYEFNQESCIDVVGYIFEEFSIDLRTVDQIVERVNSVLLNHPKEQGVIILLFFEALRIKSNSTFQKLLANEISGSEAVALINQLVKKNRGTLSIDISKNISLTELASQVRNEKDAQARLNAGMSMTQLFIQLIDVIREHSSKSVIDRSFNSLYFYLLESIRNEEFNDEGRLKKYKNYVEIASNLY
ncbi:MAG: P-loop NTPase fold protein [Pseudomonadota bacterium]|nr:P-loop NTPase fold protein [Pseudomonadota bacterium]